MFSIIATIGGFFLRMASNSVLQDIAKTLIGKSDAQSQIAVKQIEAEIEARKAARDVRLATASYWEMRLISFLIAGSFTLHLVAVTLDTVFRFGWGVPKYPAPFDEWEGVILLSFFGVQAATMILNGVVASIFRK